VSAEERSAVDDITRCCGAQLRAARERAGLRLGDVVAAIEPDRTFRVPTLCGYETGIRSFTLGRFIDICLAMQVSPMLVLHQTLAAAVPHWRSLVNDDAADNHLVVIQEQLGIARRALRIAADAAEAGACSAEGTITANPNHP
jgi:hypothetical protein